MKTDCRPDWMTITGKYKDYAAGQFREPEFSADVMPLAQFAMVNLLGIGWHDYGVWKEVKAPPHYKYALLSDEGGVLIAFGRASQGWMVQLHGTWWAASRLLIDFSSKIERHGLHVSRFDYSLTVQAEMVNGGSWAEYMGAFAEYQRDLRGDKYPIFAHPYAPSHLKTVTAGSRKSPIFIRCYDKPYWADETEPAIRLECEYKKKAAMNAFRAWTENPILCVSDVLARWFGADEVPEPFDCLLTGSPVKTVRSTMPPPPSDREKWFNGVVLRAYKKWAGEDSTKAGNWLRRCEDWLNGYDEWAG
jgi:hypothetical protein